VSDSLFSFVPGRLLWIKTRQSRAVNFGRGITLDLTTPYSVTLQAKSWTDISVPFKFNITVGDVLDSTMAGKHSTDSLRICKWTQNTIKNYMLDEVFYSDLGVKALQDKSAVFEGDQTDGIGAGYSIYNPFDEDVPCSFPPIPAAMSGHKQGAAKRTGGTGDGAIVIGAKTADGAVLNTLYCALASGKTAKRFFPAAPSLSGAVTLRVCDEHMRQFGHVAAVGAWEKDEGMSCPLSVSNHGATSDVVTISASGASGLPEGVRFMIFDPVASSFAEPGKDGVLHAQVKVAAGETGVVQLIAGGGGYCAKVKQAALTMKTELIGMYSNPFKRAVRIRFGLPFGFMGKVSFSLFDATGRKVWNSSIPGHSGINDLIWAGNSRTGRQVHTGVYVLQMKAFNAQGGQLGKFEKKLTYMP
jgi:hypothetical protein